MADLNSLIVFAKVAEALSFTEAARRLDMPVSTVSRRIADLERQLAVQLLERSTRTLRLTAVGLEVLDFARRAAGANEGVEHVVSNQRAEVSGLVRLAAPPSISDSVLAPIIAAFRRMHDAVRFEALITEQVVDFIADYYASMEGYRVHPNVTPGFLRRQLPSDAPSRPEPDAFAAALRDVRDLILPGVTHWQSPRHFAHFPASSSTAGALGEALAAGINAVPFTWAASPAATELEMVVVDWLGKALRLPEGLLFCGGGGGTLMGTSCEAILCDSHTSIFLLPRHHLL